MRTSFSGDPDSNVPPSTGGETATYGLKWRIGQTFTSGVCIPDDVRHMTEITSKYVDFEGLREKMIARRDREANLRRRDETADAAPTERFRAARGARPEKCRPVPSRRRPAVRHSRGCLDD
ncbi:hypothetical protein ACWCXX_13195 [Streptomyces sp. NPDC001732]